MQLELKEPTELWREDSPIWEIVAGELILHQNDPLAGHVPALTRRAAERAHEAAKMVRAGDLDTAGHALIGCSVALALAARAEFAAGSPIEHYASDLAGALTWEASEPGVEDLVRIAERLDRLDDPDGVNDGPSRWELAVRAGGYAAGMSGHITRRRERRDLLGAAGQASPRQA